MAITEYYCDPVIAADSGTGTIGDPFGDVQYALNSITRNSTDGDRINVKAGTAEILAAGLTLATYGTPSQLVPLVIQGYTSAAGDGGIGEIDGAATYSIFSTTANSNKAHIHFADMKLGNSGAASVLILSNAAVINCEIYGSSANPGVSIPLYSATFEHCYFHSLTGANNVATSGSSSGTRFVNCRFASSSGTRVLSLSSAPGQTVTGCIFQISTDTSLGGIELDGGSTGHLIERNSIYSSSANTGTGIYAYGNSGVAILNNIVEGFSGAGGKGYAFTTAGGQIYGGNVAYNCTTAVSDNTAKWFYRLEAVTTLAASPFTDAANGDFSILANATDVIESAWPTQWKGLATTTNYADIGAVQKGAGAGGGGRRPRPRIHGV